MSAYATALQWGDMGIAAIPVRYKSKKPAVNWRKFIDKLPTNWERKCWWGANKNGSGYGVAVITGWQDLSVIDFDNTLVHAKWLSGLSRTLAQIVLTTFRVRTRQGIHIYIKSNEMAATRTYKDNGFGFDTRGPGGYAITSPSIHPTGFVYSSIGHPRDIKRIDSIHELLPEIEHIKTSECASQAIGQQETAPLSLWERASFDSSSTTIHEIKERVTVASLVGIPPVTRRYAMIECPFHHDDHPSMVVYSDGGWRCFVCNLYGDVIDFYALSHNVSTKRAIRSLAARL